MVWDFLHVGSARIEAIERVVCPLYVQRTGRFCSLSGVLRFNDLLQSARGLRCRQLNRTLKVQGTRAQQLQGHTESYLSSTLNAVD